MEGTQQDNIVEINNTVDIDQTQPDVNPFNWGTSSSSHGGNKQQQAEDQSKDEIEGVPYKPVPKFIPTDLYYDMTGEKFVIIFNHYEYEKTKYFNYHRPNKRDGTHKDVLTIKSTFGNLGFKVVTHTDLKHHDIMVKIREVSKMDHIRTSCLVIVILTHGDKHGELYAADRPYRLTDITSYLENGDVGLVTKPKLLFIQACRGGELDAGRNVQCDGEGKNVMLVSSHIDYLIMRSSVEDFISWRESDGSWLIQELCETINRYHTELDILQMITLTTRSIAFNRISKTIKNKTNLKKQTPETRFTLTKFLKL